ncbi:helix-turn-helix domain-containing protein [Aurantiacibacter luteus]|uniref:helix-turn-helix domain-containing protein n=1 Tax=Aurantiacibacter luteus TaxID=1581420 RepID=UPI00069BD5F9|nr:DUF4019 domain-containing protein [Aurantiacibacter luteus]
MSAGLAGLTDKERQTLRLLLAGHDTKSSAAELGISVHTLSDRLRSARRKLGVTSSREAARLLGEAEGSLPEIDVHTRNGGGNSTSPQHPETAYHVHGADKRSGPWGAKGVLLMTFFVAAVALAMAFIMNAENSPVPAPFTQGDETFEPSPARQPSAAERGAREWLALIDEGEAAASRMAAAPDFQRRYSADLWELGVLLRLNNHGTPVSRQLVDEEVVGGAGGEGDFVRLVFATNFTGEAGTSEIVTLQQTDGTWRVADYEVVHPEDGCST